MHVIGCDGVVEQHESKAFATLEQPMKISISVTSKFEEEFFLVALVRDVPNVTGDEVAMSAGHVTPSTGAFRVENQVLSAKYRLS